ncbi:AAA family ATPase [Nocardia sp. NPDC004860]|uniref:AAA family ATPase n=1 Tax=Nocardia sp. NPDC004860 TaxID=3154557 RepID=UPI0033A6B013
MAWFLLCAHRTLGPSEIAQRKEQAVALLLVVPLFGPPAAGKTTLTMVLGRQDGRRVFRLREHVPREVLSATAGSSEQLGWIDDHIVEAALRDYFRRVADDPDAHTVLMDNFPGSAKQVGQFLSVLEEFDPLSRVEAVEVHTDSRTLKQRAQNRKVCHRCERDPISDPRLPAIPKPDDIWACSRCDGVLHPRRGDSPRLLRARSQRYQNAAIGIRTAFADWGIDVTDLDTTTTIDGASNLLSPLLISRSPVQ